ncbi:hypothetical protein BGZ61DRAFT_46547 [Ilyonectria robusta]|uniref:uncharacterized protein n=1 Tax=Ilyonectria robusta TaxID=1079257 RepID=UPI001E8D11C6|nr:uncharacterized protein BGZ61DRAFT_46547 [Ilyonectria robusta]KAH8686832.1 hypothetical protein BGZ61DRAFT_46547 [Ilyonectria robusta]
MYTGDARLREDQERMVGLTAGLCYLNAHRTPLVRTFVLVGVVAVPFVTVRVQLPDAGVFGLWLLVNNGVNGHRVPTDTGVEELRPPAGPESYFSGDIDGFAGGNPVGVPSESGRVASRSTVKWLLHIGFGRRAELGVGVVQGRLGGTGAKQFPSHLPAFDSTW